MNSNKAKLESRNVLENYRIWKRAMKEVRQTQQDLQAYRFFSVRAFIDEGLTDKPPHELRTELVERLRSNSNPIFELETAQSNDHRSQSCPPLDIAPEQIWRMSYQQLQQELNLKKEARLADLCAIEKKIELIETMILRDLEETNNDLFFPVDLTFGCWDPLLKVLNEYRCLAETKKALSDEAILKIENLSPSLC